MADDEYIIKTKFEQSFDFVFIEKSKLSVDNFIENGKYSCFQKNSSFHFNHLIV